MQNKSIKDDWVKITRIIKARFKKITDDNIESMEENIELLTDHLQNIYGYTKSKADKELEKIKATIHAATKPKKRIIPKNDISSNETQQI
ncbi:MAG: hypothetical protein A2381_08750 [Bdellovibrionales bacterium RIFOXYB1_FULL_37_110]|nr:MAG: hypothetical protein A2181_08945 [Bdellovibrionales bacterium RIFOXYA1_FULL_38_20]OFZ51215.1 MAG: hypothetical protein A2417_17410 [Bdellovibrionales bacterium RIFOXYC1_FULL_37_79]OFZ60929.1 MAG: hypothetical protein A2381_08750 [Bdellovibrionales bacterium RIFOXYB1_FULL_37_110]OFZ63673.1 MAG: hypothetical protein A2577_07870 [Bdellovibrionales bacterium RIFOXYD1_FULL_36_51]